MEVECRRVETGGGGGGGREPRRSWDGWSGSGECGSAARRVEAQCVVVVEVAVERGGRTEVAGDQHVAQPLNKITSSAVMRVFIWAQVIALL